MPSDQELQATAEDWKQKGNEAFSKSDLEPAIQAYSQGLVQVDRSVATPHILKAALLSNRAACYLKVPKLDDCIDDCSKALTCLEQQNDTKLRAKLLYRRAKARFLKANMPHLPKDPQDLQLAGKDLLTLLSFEPGNKEASKLLNTIRAQHASENKAQTPLAKTVEAIRLKDDKTLHHVKVLLGLLTNDTALASMELGRLQGVHLMMELAKDTSLETKLRYLALQCLSCAGSHPPFCRSFLKGDIQESLAELVDQTTPEESDMVVGALTVFLRLILHLDRDKDNEEITGHTDLTYQSVIRVLVASLKSRNVTIIRAANDVLSTWTAGPDREAIIRASLDDYIDLPVPLTKYEMHQLKPKELSDYKQRRYQKKTRDQAWAFERSMLFCQDGGLENLIECIIATEDATLRREMTTIMGKVLAALEAEEKIKDAVLPFFPTARQVKQEEPKGDENRSGPVIEEITEEDEEGKVVDVQEEDDSKPAAPATIESMQHRVALATALLMSRAEVGAWSMGSGWPECEKHLNKLVETDEKTSLCLVAEMMAAAASIKETRPIVANYLISTSMKSLVSHSDRDVRTAAASSVAKLGLAEQSTEDIEIIGLLEAACYMLEDGELDGEKKDLAKSAVPSSGATSSLERGVEVMAYLASKTLVKEELCHGFKGMRESKYTGIELMVKAAERPGAGEALSAYGLASAFQLMAVTPLTLRREAFEGKQMTMEQYDEIQNMQKTEEEKELNKDELELAEDNPKQCAERISKMAAANVPRALVQLSINASDQTLEQVVLALNRFANEPSVRGSMIQHGVLTALIKLEKEEKNPTDLRKKILRNLRHCMGKMLVTTNPSLLTSAQRMGAIKPLVQLVRDVDSSDLQKFESLMALTNIASSGDDAKRRIVTERGIATCKFAMFSDHEMVKQASTECLCNLVPNEDFVKTLCEPDELRLWLALASDFEDHYGCARAAAGCLAMATGYEEVAKALITVPTFKERMDQTLESGSLEIMHRMLVVILNLVELGGEVKAAAEEHGLIAFAKAYVDSYHDGKKAAELKFGENDIGMFNATIDVGKQIAKLSDKS